MLKKILFVLASFMLGFLLIMTVMNTTIINVVQKRVNEAVASNNYKEVKRYFLGIYDNSQENFYVIEENGAHVEMYYGLANATHTFNNDKGEKLSYDTIETGIHFSLFNLNDDFKLVDEEGKQGGIELHFKDSEDTLFFPFVVKENDEIVKNNYDSVSNFSFLNFAIHYQEYVEKVGDETDSITLESVIESVDILDGTGTAKFSFEQVNGLTFNNQLYKEFSQSLEEYNNIKKDIVSGKEVSKDTQNAVVEKVNAQIEVAKKNPNYVMQPDQSEVYGSSDFLVPVIIAAVIFLALDILVAWLLFRKKKVSNYVPPYQRETQSTQQHEPEQFNRDVFNVENYDEVESSETEGTNEVEQEEVKEEKPTTEE